MTDANSAHYQGSNIYEIYPPPDKFPSNVHGKRLFIYGYSQPLTWSSNPTLRRSKFESTGNQSLAINNGACIKVPSQGALHCSPHAEQIETESEERQEFQKFVRLIDFHLVDPLDDTVTELILSEKSNATEPVRLHGQLEDRNRYTNPLETYGPIPWKTP
ncbi:serine-threonine protein kinase [Penicillium paradoxum]|uniref:serine-threonine protein kinase n=1 Tax=Penicillium paradoxum TaxID=176176 RepID=UPI0025477FC9|nr:serine-threonine protein kinase [Penicillium paradoxum]KAJ5782945.1 serine-threonine protein kinase [Penicillium paradoxum]